MTTPPPLSQPVDALALRNRLGGLEHTYRPESEVSVQEKYRPWYIAGSLVAIAALLGGGALLWIYVHWGVALFPLWIGILATGLVVRGPLFRKGLAAKRLHLFEHGLVVDGGGGGDLFAVRWDRALLYQETVREVINYKGTQTPFNSSHSSVVVAPGGAKTELTDFYKESGTWSVLLAEAIAHAQVDKVWKAVQEGGTIGFGPYTLSRSGITKGSAEGLSWGDVSEVAVRGGFALVWRTGQTKAWGSCSAKQVPNLLVFLTIAENLRRRQPR
ncbi:DUF6585 family protein [Streptomyces sp. G-G2]|uniref:DUF6585 family protein n=1 Tax=Streptomyces sp. G-G2 TaxID=3046201 RepID=UPI0024B8F0C4|nr:DUF6585 family protein [Streptomyces sp. G-G2]MDJ0382092.1 hypothetical protein [Streptomyces sp. G-G2]